MSSLVPDAGGGGGSVPDPGRSASGFGLFRRSSDGRFPPLSIDTYRRLIRCALTEATAAGRMPTVAVWVPAEYANDLRVVYESFGYETDALCSMGSRVRLRVWKQLPGVGGIESASPPNP